MHLSPKIEQLLTAKLASGRFGSADDFISEAVEAWEERERRLDEEALAFKAEMERRLADLDAGLGKEMTSQDWSEIKRRGRERLTMQTPAV